MEVERKIKRQRFKTPQNVEKSEGTKTLVVAEKRTPCPDCVFVCELLVSYGGSWLHERQMCRILALEFLLLFIFFLLALSVFSF